MLGPDGFVEEEFRRWDHLAMLRVQKDFPHFLTYGRPSRFSGHFARNAFLGEVFFQALNLGGLATPLDAFKSDKERQRSLQ